MMKEHSMLMHFYVYNECNKPISAAVEYVHLDTSQQTIQTVLVPPGNQKMLCATNHPTVSCEGVSEDGALHWARQTFELSASEYTHVLGCQCVGEECPMRWPLPTTRQRPIEESQSK
jgi:hypothetical protein